MINGEFIIRLFDWQRTSQLIFESSVVEGVVRWDFDHRIIVNNDYSGGIDTVNSSEQNACLFLREGEIYLDNSMAFGLYRILVKNSSGEVINSIFYDTRTCEDYSSPDVYCDYNVTSNTFYYYNTYQVIGQDTLKLWIEDEDFSGIQITNCFEPAVETIFDCVISGSNQNPVICWDNALSSYYFTGFDIFRRTIIGGVPHSYARCHQILNSNKGEYFYTDSTYLLGGNDFVEYKIKTVNDSIVSEYSNEVSFGISGAWKSLNTKTEKSDTINIQIFPNPFNSELTIKAPGFSGEAINILLYNSIGQLIDAIGLGEINSSGKTFKYKMNDELASGIYYVVFIGKSKQLASKIVYNK